MLGLLLKKLSRKTVATGPKLQIPAGIVDIFMRDDGAVIDGVFRPHCEFVSVVTTSNAPPRVFPEQVLVTTLDQHLKRHEIERDLNSLGMAADHPLVRSLQEVTAGDGVGLESKDGHHDRATTFLVVDDHDPRRWYALFRLERSISYVDGELVYALDSLMSYVKPAYASDEQDFLYCAFLAGAMIGNEIERLAVGSRTHFPMVTFKINMRAPDNDAWISFARQIARSVGDYLALIDE